MSLHVIVAGGGIGGLALAQGLRRHGVRTTVLERDASSQVRGQGYRLRMDEHGGAALRTLLPDDLYALYLATSNRPYMPRGAAFDHQLNELMRHGRPDRPFDPDLSHTAVNRMTLRQILLAGLGDAVRFGSEVTGYTEEPDGVRVRLADGSEVTGDLLVGADGINSAVRAVKLPGDDHIVDTGMRCIYGRLPFDEKNLAWIPEELFGGSSPVMGPDRTTLACGVFQPRRPVEEATAELAPYAALDPVAPYLKWTLVAPAGSYPVPEAGFWTASPEQLHAWAVERTRDWHPLLHRLVTEAEPWATFPLSIRVVRPAPAWAPGRVTLLGDSVHATTPVGGVGANTALRDAALLSGLLAQADRGERGVTGAVAEYETQLRDYGYAAVRGSLVGAHRIFRTPALETLIKGAVA
ncbi:FAD-dependent monooxygenase [Streptomyces sp. ET3-23]|uniref:FAD-dependent oxidoreductase n=1 Tax=Streptomyces sp. ET3-23 TaxID=2885643 RepID=UPI001D112062|nr:NAD(P)/FAD-dependent oxidoreductase [Streptomyces sp. ET3-23]MCC2274796.1 FAD-dependent monooxygenase [Streptomyces sp. ET3-23]